MGLAIEYISAGAPLPQSYPIQASYFSMYFVLSFIPLDRRLLWRKQTAEAISYIHGKCVIHCDINLRNLLLDANLDILLADFQGMLKSADGKTLFDGLSRECSKSYQPRVHGNYACVETDLFALGSAIYFIMTGHEVFPELDSLEDDEEILSRFQNGLFPNDNHPCSWITEKCWKQQYQQAAEVVSDQCLIRYLGSRRNTLRNPYWKCIYVVWEIASKLKTNLLYTLELWDWTVVRREISLEKATIW